MKREFQVTVTECVDGVLVAEVFKHREVGTRNSQHILGEMLGDAIVAMAPDDAANVLQALIRRLDLLGDDSIRPFSELASYWRVWQVRGGDEAFSEFATVEGATK
jgi:hypothetical protein